MVIGADCIAELVRNVRPDIPVTDPVTAAFAAFRRLGDPRPGVLTPYGEQVNAFMWSYLAERGLEVTAFASFMEEDDRLAARIDAASIRKGLTFLGRRKDVDAMFISCTRLRVAHVVADIEAELGKPVTSSNHAMCRHMLRLVGIDEPEARHGRLFTLSLDTAPEVGALADCPGGRIGLRYNLRDACRWHGEGPGDEGEGASVRPVQIADAPPAAKRG